MTRNRAENRSTYLLSRLLKVKVHCETSVNECGRRRCVLIWTLNGKSDTYIMYEGGLHSLFLLSVCMCVCLSVFRSVPELGNHPRTAKLSGLSWHPLKHQGPSGVELHHLFIAGKTSEICAGHPFLSATRFLPDRPARQ